MIHGRYFRLDRLIAGLILLAVSFRVAAIPFIVLWAIQPSRRPRLYLSAVTTALVIVLASPIDIGCPGIGLVAGNHRPGVRVLHVITGMPMHTLLVEKYGEYVSTGCGGLPCAYQPRYWIVWW